MDLMKTICSVFVVIVYLEMPAVSAGGELVAELTSREDVVTWAGYGDEKLSTVVVGGKLLCHAAAADHHHKLHAKPVPVSGASVAVLCGTSGRRKKSWAQGSTGNYGEFLIDLPSYLHAIPNLEKVCFVQVLSIPKGCPCRRAFTGKRKAIKLTSIGEGARTYTTDNIHLVMKPESMSAKRRKNNV